MVKKRAFLPPSWCLQILKQFSQVIFDSIFYQWVSAQKTFNSYFGIKLVFLQLSAHFWGLICWILYVQSSKIICFSIFCELFRLKKDSSQKILIVLLLQENSWNSSICFVFWWIILTNEIWATVLKSALRLRICDTHSFPGALEARNIFRFFIWKARGKYHILWDAIILSVTKAW